MSDSKETQNRLRNTYEDVEDVLVFAYMMEQQGDTSGAARLRDAVIDALTPPLGS